MGDPFHEKLLEENQKLKDQNDKMLLLLDRAMTTLWRSDNTVAAIEKYFEDMGRRK